MKSDPNVVENELIVDLSTPYDRGVLYSNDHVHIDGICVKNSDGKLCEEDTLH